MKPEGFFVDEIEFHGNHEIAFGFTIRSPFYKMATTKGAEKVGNSQRIRRVLCNSTKSRKHYFDQGLLHFRGNFMEFRADHLFAS